ncbi:hypothetical protein RCO27_17265 [Sphingosinicella sp. LHD-64]|nr:hypothetical protein [Sphingosinicella sp. LHD-64]MDQ8757978.1 hypothetical protein [Sphingosinicella sp. LHD-64]
MTKTITSTRKRPKLYLPLALTAPRPAILPFRLPPGELRRLVAAMVD